MADVDIKEVKLDGIEVFERYRGLWVGQFLAALAMIVFAFRAATGEFFEALPLLGLSIGALLTGRECVRLWKRIKEIETSKATQG